MKKIFLFALFIASILIVAAISISCVPKYTYDNPEYVYVTSLHGERIDLHIQPVQRNILKTFNGERNLSFFNSYAKNLSEVSEALTAADENNQCRIVDDYLLVYDTEKSVSVLVEYEYAIEQRRPSEADPNVDETYLVYTYSVRNMGGWISDSDCFVMIPAYLIDYALKPTESTRLCYYTVSKGIGYPTKYSIEDFKEFYEFNGYEVVTEGNTLTITDPAPRKLSEEVYADSDKVRPYSLEFTLTFTPGSVTFNV